MQELIVQLPAFQNDLLVLFETQLRGTYKIINLQSVTEILSSEYGRDVTYFLTNTDKNNINMKILDFLKAA